MKVIRSKLQVEVLDDTAAHKLEFKFQDFIADSPGVYPLLNGNVAVWFEINLNEGADATALGLKVRAKGLKPTTGDDPPVGKVGALVVAANDIQTLLTAFAFTDTKTYSYPITSPFGAAHGLEVEFTYGVGSSGVKEATVDVWLEAE